MSADFQPRSESIQLSIGQCATLACIIEATAPKPGNVHRGADFDDATYPDFIVAAVAIGPIFDSAVESSLGQVVLRAILATRAAVATNTNLGTVLLLAPLAKVVSPASLETGVADVLRRLIPADARDVYQAIGQAGAGGLGTVAEADVRGQPPDDLIAAMRLAADRDLVARQYAEDFRQVFQFVVPLLREALQSGLSLPEAIVQLHLRVMSEFPDSLIERRCGRPTAEKAAALAGTAIRAGRPRDDAYERAVADLDFWLRSDGHRRNPGTTADLVAAGLFIALRNGIIKPPYRLAR